MKAMSQFLIAGAAFLSNVVYAGIHVENITRDATTLEQKGATQTMLVQNGMMRTNASANGAIIVKGTSIIMIDDKRRQYREMTKEDLQRMAVQVSDAMAKMQEKMKSMTPEQRAMMDKMMGNRIPGGMSGDDKPDTWEAKDLGTTATVEGRKCHNWNLIRNGAPFEELCVVPYKSLPGKEDVRKVFKDMADAFGDFSKSVPGFDRSARARATIDGYPVRTRMYGGDGQLRSTETIMTKWIEESIPAAAFEVPAGYTKAELPKLPD